MTVPEALRRAVIVLQKPGSDADDRQASHLLQRLHDAITNARYRIVDDSRTGPDERHT